MAPGFITVLLLGLLCASCACGTRQQRAAWITYLNKMTASCNNLRTQRSLRTFLQSRVLCLREQQLYLHCALPAESAYNNRPIYVNQHFFYNPCGLIVSHLNSQQQSVKDERWAVQIHHLLHLNLTFLEFNLSSSFTDCRMPLAVESLLLRNPNNAKLVPWISFCGRRTPFSLVWTSNSLLVVYNSVPGINNGYFQFHYQACKRKLTENKADIISHNLMVNNTVHFVLKISNLTPKLKVGDRASYSLHLLGSKLRVVDLALEAMISDRESVFIDAFEGPGSSPIHRHPSMDGLINGDWIYFVGFQCYIRIECDVMTCERSRLLYVWAFVSRNITDVEGQAGINLTTSSCSELHATRLIHCAFQLGSRELLKYNIQIEFESIFFDGPDYLGDMDNEYNCLLAGVTVADYSRLTYTRFQDQEMTGFASRDKDFALDSVMPELTTCRNIAFRDRNPHQLLYTPPLDTFVSTSGVACIVIYIYGGYVNLSTSHVHLTISTTTCTGLTLGCYQIPSTGFLEIGSNELHPESLLSQGKEESCPYGNMLLAFIRSNTLHSFRIQVTWCTTNHVTSLQVVSHLGKREQKSEECLMLNLNPYPTSYDSSESCTLSETNIDDSTIHQYVTETKTVHSLWCFLHEWATQKVFGNTSDGFVPVGRTKSRPHSIHVLIAVHPDCVYVSTNVTLPCTDVAYVPSSPPTYSDFQEELALANTARMCDKYHIYVGDSHTALLYVPQPSTIWQIDGFLA